MKSNFSQYNTLVPYGDNAKCVSPADDHTGFIYSPPTQTIRFPTLLVLAAIPSHGVFGAEAFRVTTGFWRTPPFVLALLDYGCDTNCSFRSLGH